jgi:hypothetical protein
VTSNLSLSRMDAGGWKQGIGIGIGSARKKKKKNEGPERHALRSISSSSSGKSQSFHCVMCCVLFCVVVGTGVWILVSSGRDFNLGRRS